MATDRETECVELLEALKGKDWTTVLIAIDLATSFIQLMPSGDVHGEMVAATLAGLSDHEKWEIRRAVAQVAARVLSPVFEPAILRLVGDDNARVRQAAHQAVLRRRDWRNADALGRQHEKQINATLEDIEARFGIRGREAVKRASEQIANTFTRELYHEVIKLISPLVTAADRLRSKVSTGAGTPGALQQDADRIAHQVAHLRVVLDAMRAYAAVPNLEFASDQLHEIVEEAADLARAWNPKKQQPKIEVEIPPSYRADVVRARLIQALTNLLINAIESYDDLADSRAAITVRAKQTDGILTVFVEDAGCGMSPEVLQDAQALFSTSKPGGTGVGLPLAVKIIESEHGGRMSMGSTKGVGTLVTVMIPTHRVARP